MPTKSGTAIMELLEVEPLAVHELVARTGYGRNTIQKNLAKFVSQGKLQRSNEEAGRSLYSLLPNGKPVIRDWTTFPEWQKNDGPIPGVWIDNPQGHLCEWGCDWITPEGIQRSIARDDPESFWWEGRDAVARYSDIRVGSDSLVAALAQAPFPENLEGGPLDITRRCLSVARTALYPKLPFLHPSTIKRTGNRAFPLKLGIGNQSVFTGVSFRPGFAPPGSVSRVLLKYARISGIMGMLGRLNDEEWADIAKLVAAFEEMEATVETQASSGG